MDHAEQQQQPEHDQLIPGKMPPVRPTLSKTQRLTRSADIRQAYAQGRRAVGSCMVLWTRTGPNAQLRLGVVASRKVGHAVARARAKRLLREVYRTHRAELNGEVDVVLVARHAILQATWNDIVRDFQRVAGRARLTQPRETSLDTTA